MCDYILPIYFMMPTLKIIQMGQNEEQSESNNNFYHSPTMYNDEQHDFVWWYAKTLQAQLTTLTVSTHHCHTPHKWRVLSHYFMETSGLRDDWKSGGRERERRTWNWISSGSCSGNLGNNPPGKIWHHAIIIQNTHDHGITFFTDYFFWLARHNYALYRMSDN
jgi:hypothetical protein